MYASLLPTLPYFNCDKMVAKKHPKKKNPRLRVIDESKVFKLKMSSVRSLGH